MFNCITSQIEELINFFDRETFIHNMKYESKSLSKYLISAWAKHKNSQNVINSNNRNKIMNNLYMGSTCVY